MKRRLLFPCFFLLFLSLFSQTEQQLAVDIKWSGIESWTLDSLRVNVVSFANARYASESNLPYYAHEMPASPFMSYSVEIKDPIYDQISTDELQLLKDFSFPEFPEIKWKTASERGRFFLEINVFPFVKRGGEVMKLSHFSLSVLSKQKDEVQRARLKNKAAIFSKSSVLSQGRFVKLRIEESGLYRLTYDALRAKELDPKNIRVFGYGGAVLDEDNSKQKVDDLPEIAVYDTGDAILFYAQGVVRWQYNEEEGRFIHRLNTYSKYGYYFVTDSDLGTKKRIRERAEFIPVNAGAVNEINEFTDFRLHEKELENLMSSGKEFYGEKLSSLNPKLNVAIEFPDIVETAPVSVAVRLAALRKSKFSFSLNGDKKEIFISDVSSSDRYEYAKAKKENLSFLPSGDNLQFQLAYTDLSGAGANAYLDFVEVNATRRLRMRGAAAMIFHNKKNLAPASENRYNLELKASGNTVSIWEISDPLNIESIVTKQEGAKLSFVDSAEKIKSYLAVDLSRSGEIQSAELLDELPKQNIHGMGPVDMLIITHPLFVEQAEQLAAAHFAKDGLRVGVVTTEEVYNEFSSGTPDATAYRWAAKSFYDAAQEGDKIKYLLLFGRGSFDNRKLLAGSEGSFVLTYQSESSLSTVNSYVSDDYFALLDDGKGGDLSGDKMDIAVGRFSVSSVEEAKILVKKTIDYMNSPPKGAWRNNLCFVGDDGDANTHMEQADSLANIVGREQPGYQIKKILLDAYQQEKDAAGESYPVAKNYLQNLLRSGLLVLTYMGHAGINELTNEKILTAADIESMTNKYLPLFVGGTCSFSSIDGAAKSGAEKLLLTKQGGAIASFSASRIVFSHNNFSLIRKVFENNAFKRENNEHTRMGDIFLKAKNGLGEDMNKLSFIYLGDPALKLNYPTEYKVETVSINDINVAEQKDTLRALSVAKINGRLVTADGAPASNFNGHLHITVFDKQETITTLNNDNIPEGSLSYLDYPNTIFTGVVRVQNGDFQVNFMLPKNIRYNCGLGRIVYSAWSEDGAAGQGHCESFYVGGSVPDVEGDYEGPEVEMYLNHPSFVSGSLVEASPLFVAKIFDKNGVSISGSGIGQDLLLMIDNDLEKRYFLNDYFVSEENSYQAGTISFKIPDLPDGAHSLLFRVWDLQNNSTTKRLNFYVQKDLRPRFLAVRSYPNPAREFCDIELDYMSENITEDINFEVFDLSGRLVASFTDRLFDNKLRWDLTAGNGQKLAQGIYLYRLSLKKGNKILRSKAERIVVE